MCSAYTCNRAAQRWASFRQPLPISDPPPPPPPPPPLCTPCLPTHKVVHGILPGLVGARVLPDWTAVAQLPLRRRVCNPVVAARCRTAAVAKGVQQAKVMTQLMGEGAAARVTRVRPSLQGGWVGG